MNASKTLDNDGSSSQVSRFQSCMLPAAPFPVVLIPYYHPWHSFCLEREGGWREEERREEGKGVDEGGGERGRGGRRGKG